jgi:hypothetical protein
MRVVYVESFGMGTLLLKLHEAAFDLVLASMSGSSTAKRNAQSSVSHSQDSVLGCGLATAGSKSGSLE